MIRPHRVLWIAVLLGLGLAVGCGGEPVGLICDLGEQTPEASEVVIASSSLDCVTRTCLRFPLSRELPPGSSFPEGNRGLCTSECVADEDCERTPGSPCISGFTCGIAVNVGPFCCRKFCICKDYVEVPESGELARPEACDPDNEENACCNLEGRVGDPRYPACS